VVRLVIVVIAAAGAIAVPATAAFAACGKSQTAPLTERPWPLQRLRPDRIWPVTRGKGVIVAVVDSGVSDDHPALDGKVLRGFDLVSPGGNGKCDQAGHGTLIAGLIAGRDIASSAFHGIAPDAMILPIRVLKEDEKVEGSVHSHRIANGIRLAVDHGATVINLSLTTEPTPELEDAVRYAQAHDVVLVAAAGNTNVISQPELNGFPAAYEDVLAVGAVNVDGAHMEISVERDYIDLAAPGDGIGPAPHGNGFNQANGTSFASAYVAGSVALLRSYRPQLTALQVKGRLLRTTDPNPDGWNHDLGYGVINPYWAVLSVTAEDDKPAPPVRVGLSKPTPDPMRGVRIIALWATVGAMGLSVLLVSSVSVWRRGQRRRWRPGRPARDA
jgi:type VII secretion-associated serine protease mycosin